MTTYKDDINEENIDEKIQSKKNVIQVAYANKYSKGLIRKKEEELDALLLIKSYFR